MFQIGEYVVHGSNGICRVNDITQLDIPGSDKNRKYYILIPVGEKGSKIYSPVESSSKVQTRKVITKKEAIQLIQEIPGIEAAWIENDKIREMVYKEALKSCDLRELVKIIKNMYLRREERFSKGKKTTILDDRYFKLAEDKLSFVMGEEREQIEEKIQERARQYETV